MGRSVAGLQMNTFCAVVDWAWTWLGKSRVEVCACMCVELEGMNHFAFVIARAGVRAETVSVFCGLRLRLDKVIVEPNHPRQMLISAGNGRVPPVPVVHRRPPRGTTPTALLHSELHIAQTFQKTILHAYPKYDTCGNAWEQAASAGNAV